MTSTLKSAAASFIPPVDMQAQGMLAAGRTMSLTGRKASSMEQIEATSKEFEAQFISQMLSSMFSTVDTKNSFGGSEEEDTFRSLMINEYGKSISRAGGIGIADQIKRDMLKMQEVSHAPTPTA